MANYPVLEENKSILRNFAINVEIFDMNNIPIDKTIKLLKNNENIRAKTVEIIKVADLYIEDYLYYNDKQKAVDKSGSDETEVPNPRGTVLKSYVSIDDMFRLTFFIKVNQYKVFFLILPERKKW